MRLSSCDHRSISPGSSTNFVGVPITTPVKYHVIEGMNHYGVYGDKLQTALDMELAWFNQYLKVAE